MKPELIVFDMDGVLVDVHASYREAIRATVLSLTGHAVSHDTIQTYKTQGGWNNDWALAQRLCSDLGTDLPYDQVVAEFQRLFLGTANTPGLIERELWLPHAQLLPNLATRAKLAVFTGRLHSEALLTLNRFAATSLFDSVIGDDQVAQSKPHPEGLLLLMDRYETKRLVYLGDTLDDARAAESAGVPFVGIVSATNPQAATVAASLTQHGAVAILDNINELEPLLS